MYKKMYKEKESKKFVLHLVHSFLPHKIGKIISWNGANQKCSICKKKVYSLDEVVKELGDIVQKELDDLFDDLKSKDQDKYRLAISSDNSDCILCFPCYIDFKKFLEMELLEGNKQFHSILDKIKKNPIKKEEKKEKPRYKPNKEDKENKKKRKYNRKNQPLKNNGFQSLKDFKIN